MLTVTLRGLVKTQLGLRFLIKQTLSQFLLLRHRPIFLKVRLAISDRAPPTARNSNEAASYAVYFARGTTESVSGGKIV